MPEPAKKYCPTCGTTVPAGKRGREWRCLKCFGVCEDRGSQLTFDGRRDETAKKKRRKGSGDEGLFERVARPFVSYDRDSQHLTAPQETEDDSEQLLMVGGGGGAV